MHHKQLDFTTVAWQVETIVISVISMLSDPTDESPANLDAAKMLREDYPTYKKKVAKCVQRSLEE